MYLSGGKVNDQVTDSLQVYNPVSQQWVDLSNMKVKRHDHATIRMMNKLYVVGGENSTPFE
jgi:N-acetylneuraminic acid mutarotase